MFFKVFYYLLEVILLFLSSITVWTVNEYWYFFADTHKIAKKEIALFCCLPLTNSTILQNFGKNFIYASVKISDLCH